MAKQYAKSQTSEIFGLKKVKVINCDNLLIFSLPNKKSKITTYLKSDTELMCDTKSNKNELFVLVYISDGVVGYALKEYLKEV